MRVLLPHPWIAAINSSIIVFVEPLSPTSQATGIFPSLDL